MAISISSKPTNQREGSKGGDRGRSYRRTFKVTATEGEDEAEILAYITEPLGDGGDPELFTPRLADIGSTHPNDLLAFVRSIRVRERLPPGRDRLGSSLEYGPISPAIRARSKRPPRSTGASSSTSAGRRRRPRRQPDFELGR